MLSKLKLLKNLEKNKVKKLEKQLLEKKKISKLFPIKIKSKKILKNSFLKIIIKNQSL